MNDPDIRLGTYRDELSDVEADLIFTSPPYNIGSRCPRRDGFRRHGLYDPKSYGGITDYPDTQPENQYQESQVDFLVWAADHVHREGVVVYNHKPRRRDGAMIHPAEWFLRPEVRQRLTLMEEVIWDRGSTHNHSDRLVWPHTERLYVFRRTDGAYLFRNTDGLEFRSDVWRIPRAAPNGHNAPFPDRLAAAVITAWSEVGDLVCDPHSGSGTTAKAATALGRRFVGAEAKLEYHQMSMST